MNEGEGVMLKKKLISVILCSMLILTISNGGIVQADSTSNIEPTANTEAIGKVIDFSTVQPDLNFVELPKEELQATEVSSKAANVLTRKNVDETYQLKNETNMQRLNTRSNIHDKVSSSISDSSTTPSTATTSDNTDPNNAYLVTNDTVTQAQITQTGELRWYAFSLAEKSKVTILLQMVEALDADLYLYSLNEETYQLELIGGSATSGLGIPEYFNNVLNAGIYFFAIGGYEGSGNFAFAYYESTKDVANEINDTVATATPVTLNSSSSGVIDNPNDIDYYKVTLTEATMVQSSITSSNNYSLLYAQKSGSNAAIYAVPGKANTYRMMPGTYYFAVLSQNGTYSSTSTYSILFKKIGLISNDNRVTRIGTSEEAGIIYETDKEGTINYINGHPIDISYSLYETYTNSAGYQSYNISIDTDANYIALQDYSPYEPKAVFYHNSTRPAMNVKNQPALMLTYLSDSNFYRIYVTGTGAYSMNTLWETFNNVTVLIDPATGKLIDIVSFNYYYDYAPVGTNTITITHPYHLSFNQ